MNKFKMNDKVKLKDSLYNKYAGSIQKVVGWVSNGTKADSYSYIFKNIDGVWDEDSIEEIVSTDSSLYLTLKEALVLALNGEKVRPVSKPGMYVYWSDDEKSFILNSGIGLECPAVGIFNFKDWEVYTPQPVYKEGDVVYKEDGDIGVVSGLELYKEKDYEYSYCVKFNEHKPGTLLFKEEELKPVV